MVQGPEGQPAAGAMTHGAVSAAMGRPSAVAAADGTPGRPGGRRTGPGHGPAGPDGTLPSGRASDAGTYVLLLRLATPVELVVGRLGRLQFRAGWYVYIGSALGGLGARLRRHARQSKPRHWHVDALREAAELVAVALRLGPERLECAAAAQVAALAGASLPAPGFGASDCRCVTHLVSFAQEPDLRLDSAWIISRANAPKGSLT
jgi:Uri superfamily endonuclease